jgi:hypothetical protein
MTDERHIDGNGVGGLLAEVLGVDPTTVRRRCASCGDVRTLAEHRAYAGAAMVLRCPSCEDVAGRSGVSGAETAVDWRGTFLVQRQFV